MARITYLHTGGVLSRKSGGRHLLSVLGCRDGLIPFSDGERRLTEFGYVHTSDFDLMLL